MDATYFTANEKRYYLCALFASTAYGTAATLAILNSPTTAIICIMLGVAFTRIGKSYELQI